MGLAILFSCTHICVNFALFQPHTAPFSVSRPHFARNGSNFDSFSIVGYFCYDGLKSQKGAFFELVIFVPSILYFRANKRTTTIFPHSKRKSREKKCRTQIEQSEHSANRINRIVKGIDDFVRLFAGFLRIEHILTAKKKSECGTFFSLYLIMMFT